MPPSFLTSQKAYWVFQTHKLHTYWSKRSRSVCFSFQIWDTDQWALKTHPALHCLALLTTQTASATRVFACSNSPSPRMWTAPLRSWPWTSVTPGKSRGRPDGRPSGSWCRSFPGPGRWSQVRSSSARLLSALCGSPAPSRSVGSGLFHCCLCHQAGSGLCPGICVASFAGGVQLHGRRKYPGGQPRRAIRSHILSKRKKRTWGMTMGNYTACFFLHCLLN